MKKSIKSSKIMVMSERFLVYKYSGGKKEEKQSRGIRKKKEKAFSFGEAMPVNGT